MIKGNEIDLKYFAIILALLAIISQPILAQECAPGCPTCSGSGGDSNSILTLGNFSTSILMIPDGKNETGIINLRTGITSWMDVGIGYGFLKEKVAWNIRVTTIYESKSSLRPGIIIGTGSVQTFKSDQSLYIQAYKSFDIANSSMLRVSIGLASLVPDFEKMYALTGITITLNQSWSTFGNFDGRSLIPGVTWSPSDWLTVAGMIIEGKFLAISLGYRFSR